jgi:hypothetical protein
MWEKVQEANALRAKLGGAPWLYVGDVDLLEGGTAVRVDRMFGYADVIEVDDLGSATGATGAVLFQTGSVLLHPLNLSARRHLRSAMDSLGMTMAALVRDYPGDKKWMRAAEMARAKWIYGQRDMEREEVLVHDRESFDDSGHADEWPSAEDCEDVESVFMEALY